LTVENLEILVAVIVFLADGEVLCCVFVWCRVFLKRLKISSLPCSSQHCWTRNSKMCWDRCALSLDCHIHTRNEF